jgi:hypothetical protein
MLSRAGVPPLSWHAWLMAVSSAFVAAYAGGPNVLENLPYAAS